jgi:integrase
MNVTAVLTGMRISEIYAIRKENLHPDYIDVIDQVYKRVLSPPRTKVSRKVPIPKCLFTALSARIDETEGDFAFRELDPQRPIYTFTVCITGHGTGYCP